jgi:hypothetical protein
MPAARLEAEKARCKRRLRVFDIGFLREHGRPPMRHEKEPVRHLCQLRSDLRLLLSARSGSGGEKVGGDGSSEGRRGTLANSAGRDAGPASRVDARVEDAGVEDERVEDERVEDERVDAGFLGGLGLGGSQASQSDGGGAGGDEDADADAPDPAAARDPAAGKDSLTHLERPDLGEFGLDCREFGLGDAMERQLGVDELMGVGPHGLPLSVEKRFVKRRLRRYERAFEALHGVPVGEWAHIQPVEAEFRRYSELREIEDRARSRAVTRIRRRAHRERRRALRDPPTRHLLSMSTGVPTASMLPVWA